MTILDCSVKSCVHNAENCCCKGTIMVEGTNAHETDSTWCGSYDERTSDSFSNSYETPSKNLEVECEAVNCVFNKEYYCEAEHISISGSSARRSEETDCASFQEN